MSIFDVIGWFIKYRSVEMKRVVNPVLDVNNPGRCGQGECEERAINDVSCLSEDPQRKKDYESERERDSGGVPVPGCDVMGAVYVCALPKTPALTG